MAETMRITAILLKDYRQFRSFYLPLVDPNTGEALTKVCLIGANATGKSTLLALIAQFLEHGVPNRAIVLGFQPPQNRPYTEFAVA